MAETITINSMTKKDENGYTDVIKRVTFNIAITEGSESANKDFTITLPEPVVAGPNDPAPSDFIALASVTEQHVKDWISNEPLYTGFVYEVNQLLQQSQETQLTTLPWQ